MSEFDKRQEGFEKKYALDEEQKFKAEARRNRLLGLWAAEKLGIWCSTLGVFFNLSSWLVRWATAYDLETTMLKAQGMPAAVSRSSQRAESVTFSAPAPAATFTHSIAYAGSSRYASKKCSQS